MFRYRLLILFVITSLSGCAWSYQPAVDNSLQLLPIVRDTSSPVLSNISMSGKLPKSLLPIDNPMRKENRTTDDSNFPNINATESEWNAYWQQRFPQTDVFSKTPRMDDDWFFRWSRHYSSPNNRPVETMQLGDGKPRVMVLGSLHGNEPIATYLAEQLARYVGNKPVVWKATSSLIVRSPNPDGVARNTFTNSRGVDLNRNFPSGDFTASNNHRTGQRAGSEVETQIVCRMMTDFSPARVVHIKTSADSNGWVIYNQKAKSTALMMGDPQSLRPSELASLQLTGSVESYVTNKQGLEMITLIVPRNISKEAAWRIYREPLLTALTYRQQAESKDAFDGTRGLNDQSSLQINPRISQRPASKPIRLSDIFSRLNPRKVR